MTKATPDPATHRPTTICQNGVGDNQVKWKVPARTSAPSTASPMTSEATGTSSEKMPSAAMLAKAVSGVASAERASSANSRAPSEGSSTPTQRRTGRHDCSV